MTRDDLVQFTALWIKCARLYNVQPPNEGTIRESFGALEHWSLDQVATAMTLHQGDALHGHKFPSTVDLRRVLATSHHQTETQKRKALPSASSLLDHAEYPMGFGVAFAHAYAELKKRFKAEAREIPSYDKILDEFDDELTVRAFQLLREERDRDNPPR